jgi:hypothetical protein
MTTRRLIIAALFTAPALLAHDGHGALSGSSLVHYLAELPHAAVWLVLVAAVAVFAARRRATGQRQSVRQR